MASEILPGKTVLEALNTDLVCDAINTAMRELFLQIVYGRTQSAFSEGGLIIGAGLEDLGKGLRSQVGTLYGTWLKVLVTLKWQKVISNKSSWTRTTKTIRGKFTGRNPSGRNCKSWTKSRKVLMLTKL